MPTPKWQDLEREIRESEDRVLNAVEDLIKTQRARLLRRLVVALIVLGLVLVIAGAVVMALQG